MTKKIISWCVSGWSKTPVLSKEMKEAAKMYASGMYTMEMVEIALNIKEAQLPKKFFTYVDRLKKLAREDEIDTLDARIDTAMKRASKWGLEWEVTRDISRGLSPEEACREWDV